jgi:hypothetical protein
MDRSLLTFCWPKHLSYVSITNENWYVQQPGAIYYFVLKRKIWAQREIGGQTGVDPFLCLISYLSYVSLYYPLSQMILRPLQVLCSTVVGEYLTEQLRTIHKLPKDYRHSWQPVHNHRCNQNRKRVGSSGQSSTVNPQVKRFQ